MKNKIFLLLTFALLLLNMSCRKGHIDLNNTTVLESRNYIVEKITSDANNRFFDWRCSFYENYLQKDITCDQDKTYFFKFDSDNFNREGFAFHVNVLINNVTRFRRTTRDFPFESSLIVPAKAVVSIQTYFEKLPSLNEEDSGSVKCKTSCP
jgi:hypothetical protein